MTGRSLMPIIALGALIATATSAGIGYGLGRYTVSGINPFYTVAQPAPEYRYRANRPAAGLAFADPFTAVEPAKRD